MMERQTINSKHKTNGAQIGLNGFSSLKMSRPVAQNIPEPRLIPDTCFYVVDVNAATIMKQEGLAEFLGYTQHQLALHTLENSYRQNDKQLIELIRSSALSYMTQHKLFDATFNLICPQRKQDGSYIKVLTKMTVHEVRKKHIFSLLVHMCDISFAETISNISWGLQPDIEHQHLFRKEVAQQFKRLFTTRETEVIQQIKLGKTTVEIAEIMYLSPHTVAAHRKNVLRKSDCHTSADMISFCKERGVV
jgi:DNA-binding NarL/FixJ family response regulator